MSRARALPELPDNCMLCGACCYGDGPSYLPVTGEDHLRLGEAAGQVAHFVGNRCYLVLTKRRCIALEGGFDEASCRCTVYERRPQVCRSLEYGSRECLASIEREQQRRAGGEPR